MHIKLTVSGINWYYYIINESELETFMHIGSMDNVSEGIGGRINEC